MNWPAWRSCTGRISDWSRPAALWQRRLRRGKSVCACAWRGRWLGCGRPAFLAFSEPFDVAVPAFSFDAFVVLLAHFVFLVGCLRNEAICFLALSVRGAPCAKVTILKFKSSSLASDLSAWRLSSM